MELTYVYSKSALYAQDGTRIAGLQSFKRLIDPGKYWDNVYADMLKSVEPTPAEKANPFNSASDKNVSAVTFSPQPRQTINNNPNVSITVNAAPGQSTDNVGKSVYDAFMESLPKGWESSSSNNAFDMPSM